MQEEFSCFRFGFSGKLPISSYMSRHASFAATQLSAANLCLIANLSILLLTLGLLLAGPV